MSLGDDARASMMSSASGFAEPAGREPAASDATEVFSYGSRSSVNPSTMHSNRTSTASAGSRAGGFRQSAASWASRLSTMSAMSAVSAKDDKDYSVDILAMMDDEAGR